MPHTALAAFVEEYRHYVFLSSDTKTTFIAIDSKRPGLGHFLREATARTYRGSVSLVMHHAHRNHGIDLCRCAENIGSVRIQNLGRDLLLAMSHHLLNVDLTL